LYLDLLKRCLVNWLYADAETVTVPAEALLPADQVQRLADHGLWLVRPCRFQPQLRAEGGDWPPFAHTMIGLKRLDNLQRCVEDVLARGVPGDLMECGVWRGGAAIFLRGLLKAHGVADRRVWVADSFAGVPPPDPVRYPADAGLDLHRHSYLAVPVAQVRDHFARYGLLDERVCFLPGWFRDTLPRAPVERLAVLRLDGDLYESTLDALTALYPKLAPGGYLIIDDYGDIPACRQAVEDYREAHGIREAILDIDGHGAYWQRGSTA
jgi:O-methyltransferase